jgi:hypothetical protein
MIIFLLPNVPFTVCMFCEAIFDCRLEYWYMPVVLHRVSASASTTHASSLTTEKQGIEQSAYFE